MTLELRNVTRVLGGETHIYPTSLTLDREGFNILLGTTQSGKTTLMQLMAGLERPTTGEVWFDGRNVTGQSVRRRRVAMVHQQFINYPSMSVYDNIASPLRVARLPDDEIRARVGEAADLLALTPMLGRRPSELSGGQQQRTALARALVKDSELVLLDEPLANLDFKLREALRDELPRLFAAKGAVVVYATTEPSEALLLGGHTVALHEGRVTGFGPTSDLYRNPGDLQTAAVFSEPPINTATVEKRGPDFVMGPEVRWVAPSAVAGLADGTYTLGLRPHHLIPEPRPNGVELSGRVVVTELSGSETVVHFDLMDRGVGHDAWVSQSHGVHGIEIGELAHFWFDPAACLVFAPDGRRMAA